MSANASQSVVESVRSPAATEDDATLIKAGERLLFEYPRMAGESDEVTLSVVMVCRALLGKILAPVAQATATNQENAVSTPALSGAVAGAIKRP